MPTQRWASLHVPSVQSPSLAHALPVLPSVVVHFAATHTDFFAATVAQPTASLHTPPGMLLHLLDSTLHEPLMHCRSSEHSVMSARERSR